MRTASATSTNALPYALMTLSARALDPESLPGGTWVCDHCGRYVPGWRRRCPWCHLAPVDAAIHTQDAHNMGVRHRVRVECLTCSRPTSLGDSAARSGRCPTCGGTLVWREVL